MTGLFKSAGKDILIRPWARLTMPELVELGDHVMIDDFVLIHGAARIGSWVHIAAHVLVAGGGDFVMGDFSGIAPGARILTGSDDFGGSWLTGPTVPAEYRGISRGGVRMERHALVGANAVVMPGVTIREGAVLGALSFAKVDLDPWTINAGCPSRVVGKRDRERMLALEALVRSSAQATGAPS